MGGVNSMCIPRTNPNYTRENHMTPRKIKGKNGMLSHAFNFDTDKAPEPVMELLNINTATEETLMTLPGVNRAVAKQIVQYRLQINGFKKVEDLAVCIGAVKLNVIRAEITVGKKLPSIPDTPPSIHKEMYDPKMNKMTRSFSSGRLRISVNDSNVFQLMKVPGLSQTLSENIVAYRDKKGLFRSLDDLVKVKGINQPLLGALKPYLVLNQMCNNNSFSNGFSRAPDGKSKASSADSASERSDDRTLSGSQFDLISHFTPLTEKHVRPIVEPYQYNRDGAPAIRIASWNLERFCRDKASNPGVLEVLCMTILENGFSIVAFQELAHRNALHKIVTELNCPSMPSNKRWPGHRGQWKVAVSDGPVGRMFQAMEYNAFVYDTSKGISCESLEMLTKGETKDFVRLPLLGYFKVDQVDFVFISVHLKATGLRNEDKDESQREARNITSLVDAIVEHLPDERDIVVAGDFNLAPSEKAFEPLEGAGYVNAIPRSKPTNISRHNPDGDKCYDNLWFSHQAQKIYTGCAGVVRRGLSHPFIPDGWTWGGLVSDHCPVWAEVFTDRDLDANESAVDLSGLRLVEVEL